jgi:type II secretory pathway component PulF
MNDIIEKSNRWLFKIDTGSRRRLYLKLAKMMENGVSLLEALKELHQRRMDTGQAKHPITLALADWVKSMQNGAKLSQAMNGWVDQAEQMLIMAGEQSGKLEQTLLTASEIMVAKKNIQGAIIGGLLYPFFIMVMAIGLLMMFSYKLIPEFSRVVPYEKWTGMARLVVDFSEIVRDWLPGFLVIGVSLIALYFYTLPRWSEGTRIKLDQWLPYSIYRVLVGSSWLISMAFLVSAGARTESALVQLEATASPWLKARLAACLRGVRSGLHLGDALLKSGYMFPDREIIEDLTIYSRLSGVDEALSALGKEWITVSVQKIQTLMKGVFAASLLFLAVLLAFEVGGLIAMQLQMASILRGTYQ